MQTNMTCLIRRELQRGMTEYYGLPDRRLGSLSFGVASLAPGDRFGETLNRREGVLVLLNGRVHVKGQGFDLGELEAGAGEPDEPPVAIYCAPGLFTVKARSEAELLVLRRECGKKYKSTSRLLTNEDIRTHDTGEGDTLCRRRVFYRPTMEGSGLFAGSTHLQPGAGETTPFPEDLIPDKAGREGAGFFRLDGGQTASAHVEGAPACCNDREAVEATDRSAVIAPAGSSLTVSPNGSAVTVFWLMGQA